VLGLTITNPTTILSFAAIFAGSNLGNTGGDWRTATVLVAGVLLGSAAWWLLLAFGAGAFRTRLTPNHLRWINVGSGLLILGFGVVALSSL
jgi:threonine/homoserine/homoserine lactone efflux protein